MATNLVALLGIHCGISAVNYCLQHNRFPGNSATIIETTLISDVTQSQWLKGHKKHANQRAIDKIEISFRTIRNRSENFPNDHTIRQTLRLRANAFIALHYINFIVLAIGPNAPNFHEWLYVWLARICRARSRWWAQTIKMKLNGKSISAVAFMILRRAISISPSKK